MKKTRPCSCSVFFKYSFSSLHILDVKQYYCFIKFRISNKNKREVAHFSWLNCIDTQPPLGDRCVQTCRNQFPAKRPGTKSNRKRHNHMIGAAHCAHLSPRVRPAVTSHAPRSRPSAAGLARTRPTRGPQRIDPSEPPRAANQMSQSLFVRKFDALDSLNPQKISS